MATFTVTTAADVVNPGDGALSLREAVGRANATPAADTIVFAPKLEGTALTLTQGQLTLTADVAIDGDRDDNGSAITIAGNGNDRVLEIAGGGTAAALADLTLTNGRAPGDESGGAILLGGGTLALDGCTVRDSACRFENGYDGYSGGSGGGIRAAPGSRLTVVDSSITGNEALAGGGISGGPGVTLVLRGSEVTSNGAVFGGALDLARGSLLMDHTTVGDNFTSGGEQGGSGTLDLVGGAATITRSTIDGNSGNYRVAGAIAAYRSDVRVADSTISDNSGGQAIYAAGNRTVLVDSTVAANDGGGIRTIVGELALRGCTVTGNTSPYGSSAGVTVSAGDGGRARLDVANSIVAGNFVPGVDVGRPPVPADIEVLGGAVVSSNGHNVFGSDAPGAVPGDREGVAPELLFAQPDPETGGGLLARHGGPTATVALNDALNNPALSGADPLDADAADQRGAVRPLPTISNPDIGAFELGQRQVSRSPSANNDVLTGSAGADTVAALAGNDLVRGLGGGDTLRGLAGSDTLDGGAGGDLLAGGAGRDLLRGQGGDDLLRGGPGADRLVGGTGGDCFDFDPGDTGAGAGRRDLVLDFARGQDRINVAAIDAVAGGADDGFAFVGRQAFTAAGQLRFLQVGGATIVQGNTDADATPELEVQLAGTFASVASDFVL